MTTNFNVDRTKNLFNGFGLQYSDTVYSCTLAANADTTLAVPLTAALGAPTAYTNNKFMAVIACTPADDVYTALNATAAKPVGSSFALVSGELVPQGYLVKMVKSSDVIHFFSTSTANVTVAFYAIQE